MKAKLLFISTCVLFVFGCSHRMKYADVLNGWLGETEESLVSSWGIPSNSYTLGGVKFITYQYSRNVHLQGTPPTYKTTIIGNTAYTSARGGSPDVDFKYYCITTFKIKQDAIISYTYQGNKCSGRQNLKQ